MHACHCRHAAACRWAALAALGAHVLGASVPGQSAGGAACMVSADMCGQQRPPSPCTQCALPRSAPVYSCNTCVPGLVQTVSAELASPPMLGACPAAPAKSRAGPRHAAQVPACLASPPICADRCQLMPHCPHSAHLGQPEAPARNCSRRRETYDLAETSSWRIALSVAVLAFAMGSNAFRRVGEPGWRACACWQPGAMRSARRGAHPAAIGFR